MNKIINTLTEEFKNTETKESKCFVDNHRPITMWVPVKYKDLYDDLQRSTNNEFSKLLNKVIIKTIEAVKK